VFVATSKEEIDMIVKQVRSGNGPDV
jgi:hypothetical protein